MDCEYKDLTERLEIQKQKDGNIPGEQSKRLGFMKELCRQTKPLLNSMSVGALQYQETIERLVNEDLHHALHSLSVVDEIRYKRYTNKNKTDTQESIYDDRDLQADSPVHNHFSTGNVNNSLILDREKRGFFAFLPLIGKVATIAVEALGSYLQR